MRTHVAPRDDRQLAEALEAWVSQGLLDRAQADRILAAEKSGTPHRVPRPSAPSAARPGTPPTAFSARPDAPSWLSEAAGYLGGALVVVACLLLGVRYWDGMPLPVRTLLALAGAGALYAAGAAVPAERGDAASRLRSVLWLGSTGACTAFLALLAHRDGEWPGDRVGLVAGAGATAYGLALWARHRTGPTALAVLGPLLLAAASAGAMADGRHTPGAAMWAVAVAFFVLGWIGRFSPRRETCILAALAAMVSADVTADSRAGLVLAVATALTVVAAGVVALDLLLLGLGIAGTVVMLPVVVDRWFGGIGSGAPVLLVTGGLLIGAAVYTARTRAL